MTDSDEYFEESLELDEAALASIQATEERFGASLSQTQAIRSQSRVVSPPRSSPPHKRLKTTHGWVEPVIQLGESRFSVRPSLQKAEDDPEIVVNSDGTYVLNKDGVATAMTGRGGNQDPRYAPAVRPLSGQAPRSVPTAESDSKSLETELSSLRAQLSELTASHAIAKQSLHEAQNEQFLKAGEASNLRRSIEKAERDHAEAIARLKSEKELAEKVKADLEAKLKEETDRMTTRLMFKQQELESSTRKRSWSSGRSGPAARAGREVPHPSQSRRTSPQLWEESTYQFSSPTRDQEIVVVKQPLFKGFQNAFTDSAPVLTRSPRKGRKADGHDEPGEGVMMSVDAEEEYIEYAGDDKEAMKEVEETLGEETILDGVDREEELRRIVFTHTVLGADMLTLQALLSTSLPESMPDDKRRAFPVACETILRRCGGKHGRDQYCDGSEWGTLAVDNLASAFVVVGEILSDAGCIATLVSVLDLMTMLTLYIPEFSHPFLSPASINDIFHRLLDPNGPSQLLSFIEKVARDHIGPEHAHPSTAGSGDDVERLRVDLTMAIIQFMESLYWNVKEGVEPQLQVVHYQYQVLEMLLDTRQSPKLIMRTLRLLVLIATHKFAFRSLLSIVGTPESATAGNKSRLTMLDQLCHYLVEPLDRDYYSIKQMTITFLGLLCNIHTDASNILRDSVSLAPSIIVCIANLSRLLWEDNPDLMNSAGDAQLVLETIYMSINFLQDLVFTSEPPINLSHKLMEVTHLPGPFNGITHMFMVTFGRLSWAEAPDWLDDKCKGTCEMIAELAIEVIETVVVGPEFDSLWAVWHSDEELDDEEVEAQMVEIE